MLLIIESLDGSWRPDRIFSGRRKRRYSRQALWEQRDKCPIVGHVEEISEQHAVVRDAGGRHVLSIDPDTYVRNDQGKKLRGPGIAEWYRPGSEVIIAHDGDRASVVRPPH